MSNKDKKTSNISQPSIPREMDWDYFSPLEVKVTNNFDKASRLFRTLVQSEQILALYKEKQSFEKPSQKKRRKHNESLQRALELEIKMEKIRSGEYEKEKVKKQAKKEKKMKLLEEANKKANENGHG